MTKWAIHRQDYRESGVAVFSELTKVPAYRDAVRFDAYGLLVCRDGEMDVEINGRRHAIGKGECVIGLPGDFVSGCRETPDFKGNFAVISPEVLVESIAGNERWSRALRLKNNPKVIIPHEKLPLYDAYLDLLRLKVSRFKAEDPYERRSLLSLVRSALLELSIDMDDGTDDGCGLMRQPELLFKRFVDMLNGKFVKPRTVAWYAERLCVTPKYLSAVCKNTSGHTAFEWIRRAMLDEICNALKYGNRSVKEVAVELGFTNMSFFGKYVRKSFGLSPKALRKELRSENPDVFSRHSW